MLFFYQLIQWFLKTLSFKDIINLTVSLFWVPNWQLGGGGVWSEALGMGSGEWGLGLLPQQATCGQLPPTQGWGNKTSLYCKSRCTFLSHFYLTGGS